MAFSDLGSLGANGNTLNNQAQTDITTTAAIAAGDLVVVVVAADNIASGGDDNACSGVTLGVGGQALTKAIQIANAVAAQAGASVSIWYGRASSALALGGIIRATFGSASLVDASALTARKFSMVGSIAIEGTPGTLVNNTGAVPGSLNVTTANIACLRVRGIASQIGNNINLTPTASWTAWANGNSAASGSALEMCARAENLISTGTSAASAPTYSNAIYASAYVAFKEVVTHYSLQPLTGAVVRGGPNVTLTKVRVGTHLDIAKTSSHITLSGGWLTATRDTTSDTYYANTLSTGSIIGGKLYLEAVGTAIHDATPIGVSNAAMADSPPDGSVNWLGENGNSIGVWHDLTTTNIYYNATIVTTVTPSIGASDVVAIALDRTAQTIQFRNVTQGGAWTSTIDISSMGAGTLYAGFSLGYPGVSSNKTINFDGTFAGTVPVGYTRWDGSPVIAATHYTMEALPGAVVLAGQTVTRRIGRVAKATAGAVVLAPKNVTLRAVREVNATAGAVVLSGTNVELTYTSAAVNYPLQALPGAVVLAGSSVTLRVGRVAKATAGAVVLSGKNVTLRSARKLLATTGARTLAGQNVMLTYGSLIESFILTAQTGAVVLSGKNVALKRTAVITALPGGIVLAGEPILLTVETVEHYTMSAGTGDLYFSRISAGLQGPTVQPGPLRFGHARVYLNRW